MFGLMKARVCSQPEELRQNRRLHYCGTCKTMGRLYGHRSRLLLNNDAVFLGELLSALSGEYRELDGWNRSYQSYNCMSLPKRGDDMPIALQFAAAAALISAEFKIADALVDSKKLRWKAASGFFSRDFEKASAQLASWQVPLDQLWQCSNEQQVIEAAAIASNRSGSSLELLERLSEPTARATGILFEHGARVIGCESVQESMRLLGGDFGRIVYLLDAVEDYEKDAREGSFNAIRAAFDLSSDRLPGEVRSNVKQEIWKLANNVEAIFISMPLSRPVAERFAARLKTNLAQRLGVELPIAHACTHTQKEATPERWRSAVTLARRITRSRVQAAHSTVGAVLQVPFVFLSALFVALIFPRQARTAKSYRECIDVAFNLMFIGSALRLSFTTHASSGGGSGPSSGPDSVFPPGYTPPDPSAGGPVHPAGQQPGKESGGKGGGGCSVCCCDCGDCCDCADCCGSCDCC